MFEKVLEALKKNNSGGGTLDVRKSGEVDQPNLPELATEITGLLDSGEVNADVDSIRVWSQSKGLKEESATTFAETVINAYFDDEEGDDMADQDNLDQDDLDNDPDLENEDGPGDGEGDEDDEALVKSGLEYLQSLSDGMVELRKSIGVIADAQMKILGNRSEDKEEILALKSELAKLATLPAVNRNPVQNDSGLDIRKGISVTMTYKEKKDLILKGISAGLLGVQDISLFENTGNLTKQAEVYITQEGKK